MEDLCEAGYQTIRGRYLNEHEVKMILYKIAKLHAVTYKLGQSENSHLVTKYNKGLFSNSTVMSMDLIRNGIDNFVVTLEELKEFVEYLPKFKAIQPNLLNNCIQLYNAFYSKKDHDGKEIFVLNHGDLHLKNLMFKFEKNSCLKDAVMVDYQLNCYAPSIIDTTYSQYLMMDPELRLRRNEFMQYYFEEFIGTLKKLDYQGVLPLYSDFQISTYKYKDLGEYFENIINLMRLYITFYFLFHNLALFLLSTFLPMFHGIIVSKAEDLKDMDSAMLIENPNEIISIYKRTSFLNDIRQYLPILLKDGYLD